MNQWLCIDDAKATLPSQHFDTQHNHKAESFNEVMGRGLFHQYSGYVEFDQNKITNQTLIRKIKNQKQYAYKFIEAYEKDPYQAITIVAALLGIKEMCHDWYRVTEELVSGSHTWATLQSFRFSDHVGIKLEIKRALINDFLSESVTLDELRNRIKREESKLSPSENIFDLLNQSEKNIYSLFEMLLAASSCETKIEKLKYLFDNMSSKIAYKKEFVEIIFSSCHANKNPTRSRWCLDALVRLYGTDVRDPDPNEHYEHLIQTVIRLEWTVALEWLIQKNPNIVNTASLTVEYKDGKPYVDDVDSLLYYAMSFPDASNEILGVLLCSNIDLTLADKNGNNIFHHIASADNGILLNHMAILKILFDSASEAVINAKNHAGYTPLAISKYSNTTVVESLLKGKNALVYHVKDTDFRHFDINDEFIEDYGRATHLGKNADLKSNIMNLFWVFNSKIPSLQPDMMIAALMGKAVSREQQNKQSLNTKLFFNDSSLCEYLDAMAASSQAPFIVNAIVRVLLIHTINVYCIVWSPSEIDVIVIEGLGAEHKSNAVANLKKTLRDKLQSTIKIRFLALKTQIQYSELGCKFITMYVASKFSYLSVEKAREMFELLLKYAKNDLVDIRHFPIEIGLLAVCQSLSTIQKAIEGMQRAPDETAFLSEEKIKNFNAKLNKNKGLQYSEGYFGLDNKKQNQFLNKKVKSAQKYIQLYFDMSQKQAILQMAMLLGINDLRRDWKVRVGTTTLQALETWDAVASWTFYPKENEPAFILFTRNYFVDPKNNLARMVSLVEATKNNFKIDKFLTKVNGESSQNKYSLFELMLIDSDTELQYEKLKWLFDNIETKIPYSRHLVTLLCPSNPAFSLEYLTRLYGIRVEDNHEALIQTVVKLNWVEGLSYLLKKDPELVQILVKHDNGPEISLLDYAQNHCQASEQLLEILQDAVHALTELAAINATTAAGLREHRDASLESHGGDDINRAPSPKPSSTT